MFHSHPVLLCGRSHEWFLSVQEGSDLLTPLIQLPAPLPGALPVCQKIKWRHQHQQCLQAELLSRKPVQGFDNVQRNYISHEGSYTRADISPLVASSTQAVVQQFLREEFLIK